VAIFRVILGAALAANFRVVGDVTQPIEADAWLHPLYHSIFLTRPYYVLYMSLIQKRKNKTYNKNKKENIDNSKKKERKKVNKVKTEHN